MPEKKTIKCPVCGAENLTDINFCQHCRYPVNVKKLNKLDKEELSVCLSSLLDVQRKVKKPLFVNNNLERLYDEFLSLNWLRPESVLLNFIEAKILLGFKDKYLKYPLLDLGCGEGLFTAILFGARLNKLYDAYEAIDFNKSDAYNTYTKLPEDFFQKMPEKIGFGVDIKETAIKKARDLAVYDQVKKGDVRELPFADESVNSVFSNMIDDIKEQDLEKVFQESWRVLKPGGCFVFITPTERFRKYLLYFNKARKAKEQGNEQQSALFLGLDRARSDWEPRPLSLWQGIFQKTSFEMLEYVGYGNENMLQFWDTGFRPFFYYLMNLRNSLQEKSFLLKVKQNYLEMLRIWLFPFTENQAGIQDGGFAVIAAKKKTKKNEKI